MALVVSIFMSSLALYLALGGEFNWCGGFWGAGIAFTIFGAILTGYGVLAVEGLSTLFKVKFALVMSVPAAFSCNIIH